MFIKSSNKIPGVDIVIAGNLSLEDTEAVLL